MVTKHSNMEEVNTLFTVLIGNKDKNSIKPYLRGLYQTLVIARHFGKESFSVNFDLKGPKSEKLFKKACEVIKQALIIEVSVEKCLQSETPRTVVITA